MAFTFDNQLPLPRRCSASPRSSCSSARTSSTSSPNGCGGGSAIRPRSRRSTCAAGRCSSRSRSLASFVLTQTAASAPLAGAWDGVEDGLLERVAVGLALPADGRLDPPARARRSGRTPRSARSGTTNRRAGDHDPAQPDRQDRLLLARLDLRPDRPERAGARQRRRRSTSRRDSAILDQRCRRRPDATATTASRSRSRPANSGRRRSSRRRRRSASTSRPELTTVGTDGYFATLERERRAAGRTR